MRNLFRATAGLFAISAFVYGPALAQTATDQFNVQITIDAECQINSASDMDFGTAGVLDADVTATSTIGVQCTGGTPYDIGLNEGLGAGATVETRLMTGPNGETLEYFLYTDAAGTDVWGNTVGTNTVAGTGTGAEQTLTVYGRVPSQDAPATGIYTDTVTATVTY